MKQITVVSAAILIAMGFAIDANADDRGERRGPVAFADIDTNADSLLSLEELQAMKANKGRKGDRKGGGKRRMGLDPQERLSLADTDGDGYLNEAEFDAAREVIREKMRELRKNRHNRESEEDAAEDDTGA
tara:strand:- start:4012 stop:4404 length:393 start_codon:yes stop_codon:yes gene_type:complete